MKPGKAARVFNILSAPYNMLLARYHRPLYAFMRANFEFFECAVGVDMSSSDAMKVIDHLAAVQPALDEVEERDAVKLDKGWSPFVWDGMAMIGAGIAAALCLDPTIPFSLYHGLKHTRFELKGDVFEAGWNPSGQSGTVEVNSVFMSAGDRYTYYRDRHEQVNALADRYARMFLDGFMTPGFTLPRDGFTYRQDRAITTYGDDCLAVSRPGHVQRPDAYALWRTELGVRVTNAKKEERETCAPITEVSFLKRTPRWDEGLGRYVFPLNLKTIAKMLTVRGDSTLSEDDHMCVGWSNALRELVLHGEEQYNRVREVVLAAAVTEGVENNPNLIAPRFEVRRDEQIADTFSVWATAVHQGPLTFSDNNIMSISTDHSATNSVVPTDPSQQVEGVFVTDISTTETSGPVAVVEVPFQRPQVSALRSLALNDYLTRWVQIKTVALPDTGTVLDVLTTFDPSYLFFSDPGVQAKVSQFSLFRGDMEILAVAATPPGAYGMYEVSALPLGGTSANPFGSNMIVGGGHLIPQNCRQVDIHATLDCNNATEIELVLPFYWAFDYVQNPSDPTSGATQYEVSVVVLSPMQTAVPGGTAAGSVTFFARLREGYELAVPVMQGPRPKGARAMAGHVMSTLSDAGRSKPKNGPISSVAAGVQEFSKKLSTIPVVGTYASVVEGAASAVANVAAFFGFTRDLEPPRVMGVTNRGANNLGACDYVAFGERAALIPGVVMETEGAGGTQEDIGAFPSLFKRWVLADSADWAPSDPNDTRLLTFPVAPGVASNVGSGVSLCTGGYVGLPFDRWRGDMEYMVEVVCSSLHRGT